MRSLECRPIFEVVTDVSGQRAIAELQDDRRGIHDCSCTGAINEAKVAQLTDGREVCGVNDTRLQKLARLFGRGNDTDFKKAYIALEDLWMQDTLRLQR